VKWALEDRRLIAEQKKGVLGPAHRRWRGNSPGENRQKWNAWDWSSRGEQWNVSDAWKRALIDEVLCRWMPEGGALLEIGSGGGRWSEALAARASRLTLVDVSERALEICRERFRDATNVEYVLSSGTSIPRVTSGSIDGVWSFDVFVHIAPCDQADYLTEIARVLAPGGIVVIHHADGRNRGSLPSRHGWRAPMSCGLFAALAAERGLRVERHIDSWGPDGCYDLSGYHDAITICTRS
jgi:SAM-dependent methyltransferase